MNNNEQYDSSLCEVIDLELQSLIAASSIGMTPGVSPIGDDGEEELAF